MQADLSGELSKPVRYTEATKLNYLYEYSPVHNRLVRTKPTCLSRNFRSAVIHEALRIHPSTGTILERCVPRGGITLHGKYLAENTTIGVNCWVIHRNKEIFGEDVENFRPERWIYSAPEAIQKMRLNLFTVRHDFWACYSWSQNRPSPKSHLANEKNWAYFLISLAQDHDIVLEKILP